MRRICAAPGCSAETSTRYGRYCQHHVAQRRRHGAINQKGITKADLKRHRVLVKARLEKNKDTPLLAHLETRWRALMAFAESTIAESLTGRPMQRHHRQAAYEVVRLGKAVPVVELMETILAIYVMQDQEPARFRDDQAFKTQMVRRVRSLTTLNAGTWYDHASGKTKLVYRELPPKTAAIIGQWLAETLGSAGLRFAQLERQEHERKLKEMQEYHAALGELE